MANNEIKGTIALLTLAYQVDDRFNRNAHDFLDLYVSKLGWKKDGESKELYIQKIKAEAKKAVDADQIDEFISGHIGTLIKKNNAIERIKKILSIDDVISEKEQEALARMMNHDAVTRPAYEIA